MTPTYPGPCPGRRFLSETGRAIPSKSPIPLSPAVIVAHGTWVFETVVNVALIDDDDYEYDQRRAIPWRLLINLFPQTTSHFTYA